ncbi:MAG: homoserine kinase [Burkholderiaceae bacterium]
MAVYTEVPLGDAAALLARLDLGRLRSLEPCSAGIENTNYFADTDTGHYVLTVFERLSFEQLPFYLQLMKHMAHCGIPVPEPHADAQGSILHTLLGKPAAVVSRLPGRHELAPQTAHCTSVAAMLARMHLAGRDFAMHQPNLRGLAWWQETAQRVRAHLTPDQREIMDGELAFQTQLAGSPAYAALPRGPIHGDLFRDNVMFEGDRLTGFFDFYFAGVDALVFDIAVCLNDWCSDTESGRLIEPRAQSFVGAYDAVRPLSGDELRLLAAMMRAAALRFWLSRLWDLHLPRSAHLLQAHDPAPFERVLRARIASPWHYLRN